MIYRHMLWGYYKEKNICISSDAYFGSIAYYENKVFIYIESENNKDVREYVIGDLYHFPDNGMLMEMSMVFSY